MSSQLLADLYLCLRKKQYSLTHSGIPITVNSGFGIFVTVDGKSFETMPPRLRAFLRPFYMHRSEDVVIFEQLLKIAGFGRDHDLPSLICSFSRIVSSQLLHSGFSLSLTTLKEVIRLASESRSTRGFDDERRLFLTSLNKLISPQLSQEDKKIYYTTMNNMFGPSSVQHASENVRSAVVAHLSRRDHHASERVVDSIVDCFEVVSRGRAIYVNTSAKMDGGCEGSVGASLVLDCLAQVSWKIGQKNVAMRRLYPRAYSLEEMYGEIAGRGTSRKEERQGVVNLQLKEVINDNPAIHDEESGRLFTYLGEKNSEKWLVFDGVLTEEWFEFLISGINAEFSYLIFPNYQKFKIPANLRFLFLSPTMSFISPSNASRMSRIFIESDYTWKNEMQKIHLSLEEKNHHLEGALSIGSKLSDYLRKYFTGLFDSGTPLFDQIFEMSPIDTIRNFYTILEAFLRRFFTTFYEKEEHKDKLIVYLSHLIMSSAFLGIGMLVSDHHRARFSSFTSDSFHNFKIADKSLLFSKGINFNTFLIEPCAKFCPQEYLDWTLVEEAGRRNAYEDVRVVQPHHVWLYGVVADLMKNKVNVVGVGSRSSAVGDILCKILEELGNTGNDSHIMVSLDGKFMGKDLTDKLKKHMDMKSKKHYNSRSTLGNAIVVIEDLNMPEVTGCGDVPALEMLRCLVTEKSFVDPEVEDRVHLEGLQYFLTMDPSKKPQKRLSRGLRQHFFVFSVSSFEENESKTLISLIFEKRQASFFSSDFTPHKISSIIGKCSELILSCSSFKTKLSKHNIPADRFSISSLISLASKIACISNPQSTEHSIYTHTLNQIHSHISRLGLSAEIAAEIIEAMRQQTSSIVRDFDWQGFSPNDCTTRFSLLEDPQTLECFLEPESAFEFFKSDLQRSLGLNVEFKRSRDFFFLDEVYKSLYRIVERLSVPGGHAVVSSSHGVDTFTHIRISSIFIGFDCVNIDTVDNEKQYELFLEDFGKAVREAMVHNRKVTVCLPGGHLRDSRVLRVVQRLVQFGDVEDLKIDKSKVRDLIMGVGGDKSVNRVLKEVVDRCLRIVFTLDSPFHGGNGAAITELFRGFEYLKGACEPVEIKDWNKESYNRVSADIFESQEDKDMEEEEIKACSSILIEIYMCAQSVSEESSLGIVFSPVSFIRTCYYFCEAKTASRNEITDNLRNFQSGISRIKALSKMQEELVKIEEKLGPVLQEKEELIEELIMQIDYDTSIVQKKRR